LNLQLDDPKSYTLSICTACASENGLAHATLNIHLQLEPELRFSDLFLVPPDKHVYLATGDIAAHTSLPRSRSLALTEIFCRATSVMRAGSRIRRDCQGESGRQDAWRTLFAFEPVLDSCRRRVFDSNIMLSATNLETVHSANFVNCRSGAPLP